MTRLRRRTRMHELSIAMNVVEAAREEAENRGGHVVSVHLKLGALSGVVKEALLGCYEMASAGTPLEGSRLVIEEAAAIVYCPSCRERRRLSSIQWFRCAECGSPASEVLEGREVEVTALEFAA